MIKCTPINYELCSFVKVAKLNKMCKCHTLVFATELIFDDNPKSSSTVPEIYCGARRGDANFLASIHKYIIPYRADISLDWGGARLQEGNPRRHRENIQTSHTKEPAENPFNVLVKNT